MCFSATASFTAAAGLSIVGLISIAYARTPLYRLLACTPLFFGIQQSFEGLLWLYLPEFSWITRLSTYGFLFFAFLFWPVWIPALLYYYEQHIMRKKIIGLCVISGIAISIFFAYTLMVYSAQAAILNHHIFYAHRPLDHSLVQIMGSIMYVCATVVPLIITSIPYLWVLGVTVASAYLISLVWYTLFLTSTWCFFAAVLSAMVGYIVYRSEPY
jgi:hypothetical protein